VNQILFFIGKEKTISNIKRYEFQDILDLSKFINLTTKDIYKLHKDIPNCIRYNSGWTKEDTSVYFNHLLFRNYLKFKRGNTSLNMELRVKLLGPYKLKTFALFLTSIKYLYNTCKSISWLILIKSINKKSEYLLFELRNKGKIGLGDIEQYKKILLENSISAVVTFSSLKDPKLFDLSIACKILNIELHYFPECWDNVSTGFEPPSHIRHMHLWSKQQMKQIADSNSDTCIKTDVYGSYRATRALSSMFKTETNFFKVSKLSILYLEGYFYEDLSFTINKIIEAIIGRNQKISPSINEINLIIRKYPLKRQTINVRESNNVISHEIFLERIKIVITESFNSTLAEDLAQTQLIFSELTTAGLEAALSGYSVIFIGSKRSPRYLDSSMAYRYTFAQEVPKFFEYIEMDKKSDQERLSIIMDSFLFDYPKSFKHLMPENHSLERLTYFAEGFNLERWNSLISNLKRDK